MNKYSRFEDIKRDMINYSGEIDKFQQELELVIEMTLYQHDNAIIFTSAKNIEVNLWLSSTIYKFINLVAYFERISDVICAEYFNGDYSCLMEEALNSNVRADLDEIFRERDSLLCISSTERVVNPEAYFQMINRRSHDMSKFINWYCDKI